MRDSEIYAIFHDIIGNLEKQVDQINGRLRDGEQRQILNYFRIEAIEKVFFEPEPRWVILGIKIGKKKPTKEAVEKEFKERHAQFLVQMADIKKKLLEEEQKKKIIGVEKKIIMSS